MSRRRIPVANAAGVVERSQSPQSVRSRLALLDKVLRDAALVFAYYPRLQRVRDYIRLHWPIRVSVKDAARLAAYDPSYFSYWFHRHVGMTYRHWLKLMRLREACTMMCQREASISEIAEAAGFKSVRTFERAFRCVVGRSPREFKLWARPGIVTAQRLARFSK